MFKTVALVTVFACFERFLGFLYRIFLSRSLGAEGMGLYQITLSVVGVLVMLTASGTPITVSRLMMKWRAKNDVFRERQVISAGILTSLMISVPITVLLYVLRNKLSFIFADERCYEVLIVILPGIVLTSVYAVIRGVFWGNKQFFTYSLIELIEEIAMLVFGFFLISRMQSVLDGTLRAGLAICLSYVVSFALSTAVFIIQGGRLGNPVKQLLPLAEASLPITLMKTAGSLLGTLIAIILPKRLLSFGLTSAQALAEFGEMSGMALPLLFIPSTVIGSIALVIVPELSENYYMNRSEALTKKISNSIKCSVLISAFIFPVFIACGEEIGVLVYSNENAGHMLAVSSIMMLPMSITLISTSILNSLNFEKKTLLFYVIGAAAMLVCVWFLPKYIGVYSLIAGYIVSYVLTVVLNLGLLEKTFSKMLVYKKHAVLTTVCALAATLFGHYLKGIIALKTKGIWLILPVFLAISAFNAVCLFTAGSFGWLKDKE